MYGSILNLSLPRPRNKRYKTTLFFLCVCVCVYLIIRMTPEETGLVVTGLCLLVSELLPFVDTYKGNGVLHVILSVLSRLFLQQKGEENTA